MPGGIFKVPTKEGSTCVPWPGVAHESTPVPQVGTKANVSCVTAYVIACDSQATRCAKGRVVVVPVVVVPHDAPQ